MPGLINYTVERSRVPVPEGNPAIGYRLKVTCTGFTGGPDNAIFCFKRVGADLAQFSNVASFADMEDFAAAVPVDADVPFFRADTVDLIFRDPQLLEETLALMLDDFLILTTGLETTNALSSSSTGTIPDAGAVALSGVIGGNGVDDTYTVLFPAAMGAPPAVYVRTSSPFGVAVSVDALGFSVVASRTLTTADTISWHLG